MSLARGGRINADLTALIPAAERDPVIAYAAAKSRLEFERRLVVLVGAANLKSAQAAAEDVHARLDRSGAFASLRLRIDREDVQRVGALYFSHRFQLLSRDARRQLTAGDQAGFQSAVLARYYGLASAINSELIQHDPLLLLSSFLEEKEIDAQLGARPRDGMLSVRHDGRSYVLLSGILADTPFSFDLQTRIMPVLQSLKERLAERFPGAELLIAGALPHAAQGTASARSEVSTLGSLSLAGVAVLLISVFRSWQPLALSALSIAVGCLVACSACLAAFGQVHLLTLVFGASLVGISVDYSLHYFCERSRLGANEAPILALRRIFPGITLGLVTSIVGFAGLLFAPLPGLRQLAVFSAAGLIGAYLCVTTWDPVLSGGGRLARPGERLFAAAAACERWWLKAVLERQRHALSLVLAVIGIAGCALLVPRDDIRLLQARDPGIVAEEDRVRTIVGLDVASQFYLVEGRDRADLLAREERLAERLRQARREDHLSGFISLSDFVPSPARQAENRDLIEPLIVGRDGAIQRIAGAVGLRETSVKSYAEAFAKPPPLLTLDDWLETAAATPYRGLWLGETERGVASIVALKGLRDPAALRRLAEAESDIHFVDIVDDISAVFAHSRSRAMWLTLAAHLAVSVLVVIRYGWSGGLRVMLPPMLAALLSLGILGLTGEPLSLFHVMAVFIVLGMGVDYSIFMREAGTDGTCAVVAVALSAMTTILGFGLLVFSSTSAINNFGMTVMIGIAVAFLLSPLARSRAEAI